MEVIEKVMEKAGLFPNSVTELNHLDSGQSELLNVTNFNRDMEYKINSTLMPLANNVSKHFTVNQNVSWIDTGYRIIPLYSVIFLLAVIGNSLVILTLVQNKRMRTITNLFLLNLSISDLFLGVFCMPFTLSGTLLRNFVFGEIMCKLLPYLQGVFVCGCDN